MNMSYARDGVGVPGLHLDAGGLSRLGLIACLVLLVGCSSLDPRNLFGRDPPEVEAAGAETRAEGERELAAAEDEPYPDLAQVPARPRVEEQSTRERVTEGLIADRENARYTAEAIERRSELAALPQESSPTERATAPPPPTAPVAATPPPDPSPEAPPAPPAPVVSAPPPEAPPAPPAPVVSAPPPEGSPTVTSEKAFPPPEDAPPAAVARAGGDAGAEVAAREADVERPDVPPSPTPPEPQVSRRPPPESPTAEPTAPAPAPLAIGAPLWIATIQFGHGSASLDGRDLGVLQQVVDVRERLGGRLRVVGHASGRAGGPDRIKQQMANFDASMARANVVAQALMDMGVGPAEMVVEARSDSEPLYRETTPAGEAGNRRTEIFIVR